MTSAVQVGVSGVVLAGADGSTFSGKADPSRGCSSVLGGAGLSGVQSLAPAFVTAQGRASRTRASIQENPSV